MDDASILLLLLVAVAAGIASVTLATFLLIKGVSRIN